MKKFILLFCLITFANHLSAQRLTQAFVDSVSNNTRGYNFVLTEGHAEFPHKFTRYYEGSSVTGGERLTIQINNSSGMQVGSLIVDFYEYTRGRRLLVLTDIYVEDIALNGGVGRIFLDIFDDISMILAAPSYLYVISAMTYTAATYARRGFSFTPAAVRQIESRGLTIEQYLADSSVLNVEMVREVIGRDAIGLRRRAQQPVVEPQAVLMGAFIIWQLALQLFAIQNGQPRAMK